MHSSATFEGIWLIANAQVEESNIEGNDVQDNPPFCQRNFSPPRSAEWFSELTETLRSARHCFLLFASLVVMATCSAAGWPSGGVIQVCNQSDFNISAAYVLQEADYIPRFYRRGWYSIPGKKCADVIDLGEYDDSVFVSFLFDTVGGDGQTYHFGGDREFCVHPQNAFSAQGRSEGSMRQCRAGEERVGFTDEIWYQAPTGYARGVFDNNIYKFSPSQNATQMLLGTFKK